MDFRYTWRAYLEENGLYQFLGKLASGIRRRVRDMVLSRHIGCDRIRVGERPKIRGLRHLSIGSNFAAGDYLWLEAVTQYNGQHFDPRIVIGCNVGISDSVHIAATSEVVIEDGVLIGSRVLITDHGHGYYSGRDQSTSAEPPALRRLSSDRKVRIGKNVWIGDGVVILGGAIVGSGAVIGANSVVTGGIPPNCIAAGTPAKPIKYFNETSMRWEKKGTEG